MIYLSLAQALLIAEEVTGISAGTTTRISRIDLLESALNAPLAGFGEQEFYPEIFEKAAVLGSRIVRNHPLQDGNKRLSWSMIVIFMDLNGYELVSDEDDAVDTVLKLAAGELTEALFAVWIKEHSTAIPD